MLILLMGLFSFACEEQDQPECVKGKVIGYQPCYNVNLIQVLSGNLKGESILWKEKYFDRVVQFPGGALQDSVIYFNYEFFDPDKDEDFINIICPTHIAPLGVPIISITNYSTSNCPLNNEN